MSLAFSDKKLSQNEKLCFRLVKNTVSTEKNSKVELNKDLRYEAVLAYLKTTNIPL